MDATQRTWQRYMNQAEAAKYAGVSVNTIKSWVTAGYISYAQRGSRKFYDSMQIDAYLRD